MLLVFISAAMENSTEELREEINEKEVELTEEKAHNNLKGTFKTLYRI